MTERKPIAVPKAFQEAIAKQTAAQPSPSDLADAIPDEFAVETEVPARGKQWPAKKRIDYKKIKIKNADGTPNRTAKKLIELHEPAARVGADIAEKLHAGDYNDRPMSSAERQAAERMMYLVRQAAEKYAKLKKFTHAGRRIGDAMENIWRDRSGFLHRLTFDILGDSITVSSSPLNPFPTTVQ